MQESIQHTSDKTDKINFEARFINSFIGKHHRNKIEKFAPELKVVTIEASNGLY